MSGLFRGQWRRAVRRGVPRCLWLTACVAGCVCGGAAQTTQSTPAASPATGASGAPGAAASPQAVAAQGAATQAAGAQSAARGQSQDEGESTLQPLSANLTQYSGQVVETIRYEGVDFDKTDRLQAELSQKAGEKLDADHVRQTTRRLFATGRYRDIAVRVAPSAGGVTLIFVGVPRYYVGRVQVTGVQEDRLASLIEYGSQLNPGAAFNAKDVDTATAAVKEVLATNGYFQPTVAVTTLRDDAGQQMNVTFTVAIGPQARVGNVTLEGKDPGITKKDFRKKGKLKLKTKVSRDTASNALSNLRAYYQKRDRLEATVSLRKSTYDAASNTLNYDFQVEQGPVVKVDVNGAKFSKSRLHLLVPVFEEGTVDNDLLNEGSFNMKDYLQQQGFFDATVAVKVETAQNEQTVVYSVDKGARHKVVAVEVQGNKYFDSELLKASLKVQKGDAYQRSGRFSQQLVTADEKSLLSIYRANGFNAAKVTGEVKHSDATIGKLSKFEQISVLYKIEEGTQQKFGEVKLGGVTDERKAKLTSLLQTTPGQPFSLLTLSGDRDAILGFYLSNGYDQAKVEVGQVIEGADKSRTDVSFNVTEGEQVFIGKVLQSGVHFTKPAVVNDKVLVHAGDPLDQSALLETQRNLYDLALFNEVIAAVQNPTGDAEQKNVLLQMTEAKRWDVTYGFGFEVQTGVPSCQFCTQQGMTAAQQGKAGASFRVSLDVSRINLFGTQDSLSLHTTYGLLERVATLTFQNPHLYGRKNLAFQVSGGYTNVQDITTFASSTLQGDVRLTQKVGRKDTFIYNFEYRRVAVDPNSLAISANLIPLLSEPVRVGGPGITWFHDTRTPNPLDAQKGSYTSVQNFLASSKFGSQTDFNRTDVTNSTYYTFGKRKYTFARNTRLGFIASFGVNPNASTIASPNTACVDTLLNTNASCNPVPLPERLYAGGATSHRGFPINGAGPRDLQTGYPVGGSGALINQLELRLPAPVLPIVGDSVSLVIFHDMGNVFQHPGDIWPSFGRFHQPNEQTCENVTNVPNGIGTCNFNYFSHAVGVGARYKTPVGPIRVDLSYNLNPPRYPVITEQTSPGVYVNNQAPYVGQGSHFNFFFSIGAELLMIQAQYMTSRMAAVVFTLLWAGFALAQGAPAPAVPPVQTPAEVRPAAPPSNEGVLVDQVIAVVNGDLVLESDVDEERRFQAFQPLRGAEPFSRQAAINRLIDRALILQQAKVQPDDIPSDAEVQAQLNALRKDIPACREYHCDTEAGWQKFVQAQGFSIAELTERWRQRMEILRFIEQRFRAGIRIEPQEIKDYYDKTLVPDYAKQNAKAPPLDTITDRVQEILLQERVTSLLEDWLKSLKAEGSVRLMKPGEVHA